MKAVLYLDGRQIIGDIVEISLSQTMDEMVGGYVRAKTTASVEVALHE